VEWQQPVQKRIAVDTNQANELLQVYLGSGRVPPEVERQLRQLLELQSRISDHRKEEERLRKQRNGLNADSERVRENLNVLRRTRGNSALEQELARKLATLERELGLISGRQVQLSEAVAELEAKVKALIKDVSLDAEQSAR
jgi:chromosome segregation ATPase